MPDKIIQMKISLDYIDPEIWRRFIVVESITLHKLHEVIQVVMGWTDSHLHSFMIGKTQYQPPDPEGGMGLFGFGPATENSLKIRLSDFGFRARQKFRYTYDFGDNWDHTIIIEKIFEPADDTVTPLCLEGQRNRPPEDCGSFPGYERILEVLSKKKKTAEEKELLEWLGDEYNPEYFDIEEINTILKPWTAQKPTLKVVKGGGGKKQT